MGKRKYSDTFKEEAVRLVRVDELSFKEASKRTGASSHSLRAWVLASEQSERERPATKQELTMIRKLKRRVAELEEEKIILKKATRLFAENPDFGMK